MGWFLKFKSLFSGLLFPKKEPVRGHLIRRPLLHHRVIKRLTNKDMSQVSLNVIQKIYKSIHKREFISDGIRSPLQNSNVPFQRSEATLRFPKLLITNKYIKKK